MFSNIYGTEGVESVTEILKKELITDDGNLGLQRLEVLASQDASLTATAWPISQLNPSYQTVRARHPPGLWPKAHLLRVDQSQGVCDLLV